MKYKVIGSSSKGNCIIVNNYLMLDCGVSYKKIKDCLKNIKIIFISHEHHDHLNPTTIVKIIYEYPNIKFLVGRHLVNKLVDLGVNKKNIITFVLGSWYDIGIFKTKMELLYHDVPNCCLHIEFKNGEKLFYAVDTNSLEHIQAKNYNLYLVEGNFEDKEKLEEEIAEKKRNGEFTHLERVLRTHMWQVDSLNWLDKNTGVGSKYIFIHQHQEKERNEKNEII